jgi:hypothetical protein
MEARKARGLRLLTLLLGLALFTGVWLVAQTTKTARPQVAVPTLENARRRVVTQVLKGDVERTALFAYPAIRPKGTAIATWRNPRRLVAEEDSWFFFVDEMPGANWEHPAKFILLGRASGRATIVAVQTPPTELIQLQPLTRVAQMEMAQLRRNVASIRPGILDLKVVFRKHPRYAVLVSGGWDASSNYGRYWNDLQSIYKALKSKYGYTDSAIIVLYANGTHSPNGDFDGNGTNDIDYAATKANLTTVFNTVAANISSTGELFFYSTNHGGFESGHDAFLYLWGETIRDDEFAPLAKKVVAKEAIFVMEQCYSGGMMDDVLAGAPHPCTAPAICFMTAAKEDEVSWSCDTEGAYDEYVFYWTAAVHGKKPDGTAVNADTNGDGKVSMSEAHTYAKNHDSRSEHPLIGSCVTSACDAVLGN